MQLGKGSHTYGEVGLRPDKLYKVGCIPKITDGFTRTRVAGQCQQVSDPHFGMVGKERPDLCPGVTDTRQMGYHRAAMTTRNMPECDVGDHFTGSPPVAATSPIGDGHEVRMSSGQPRCSL